MDSKDQPVFGYTFNNDAEFFGGSPTQLTHGGPQLLSENENNLLLDFFTNTDPYMSEAPSTFPPPDTKNGFDDFNWGFVPPASVHQVSTTIADQAQLHHGFPEQTLHSEPPLSAGLYTNTNDEMRAASALFNNAQAAHMNARSYSVPNLPHGHSVPNMTQSDVSASHFRTMPMVNTPHGPIDEQLAALLPHHSQQGSIDELVAAQFTQARNQHDTDLAHLERQRPSLKRSYTYGTDSAFNSNGYVAPEPGIEDAIHQRLAHDLRIAQPIVRPRNGESLSSPSGHIPFSRSTQSEDGEQTEEETTDDDDRPAKKRQKSKVTKNGKSPRKSLSSRPAKNRKASVDEAPSKRKRLSSAGQKAQRENLSEEQKRSNHILSEQKRRNLIKRGFDDLHDLVPEIRNGGLSKSAILMAAADFLEGLIHNNNQHTGFSKTEGG